MPSTQAAGAGMSAARAARSSRKPAVITTNTNSVIAPKATGSATAPLSHSRPASGGDRTSVAASVPEPTGKLLGSAAECIAAAPNHVVLLRFEADPKRQAHEPISRPIGDAHGAAGAAELPADGRAMQRHIMKNRIHSLAPQRVDEALPGGEVGEKKVIAVRVRRSIARHNRPAQDARTLELGESLVIPRPQGVPARRNSLGLLKLRPEEGSDDVARK